MQRFIALVLLTIAACGSGSLSTGDDDLDGDGGHHDGDGGLFDGDGSPLDLDGGPADAALPELAAVTRVDWGRPPDTFYIPRNLLRMPDGDYLILGYTQSAAGNDGLLARLGPDGSPEWVRTYAVPGGNAFNAATALPGGDLIVGGTASGQPLLLRLDPQGQVVWARRATDGTAGAIADLATLPGGDVVAALSVLSRATAMRVDASAGVPVWASALYPSEGFTTRGAGIAAASDGSVLLSAQGGQKSLLVALTAAGDGVRWTHAVAQDVAAGRVIVDGSRALWLTRPPPSVPGSDGSLRAVDVASGALTLLGTRHQMTALGLGSAGPVVAGIRFGTDADTGAFAFMGVGNSETTTPWSTAFRPVDPLVGEGDCGVIALAPGPRGGVVGLGLCSITAWLVPVAGGGALPTCIAEAAGLASSSTVGQNETPVISVDSVGVAFETVVVEVTTSAGTTTPATCDAP